MIERTTNNPIGFRTRRIEGGYIVTIDNRLDLIVASTDTKEKADVFKAVSKFGGLTALVDFEVDGRWLILSTYGIDITDPDQREVTDIIATMEVGGSIINLQRLHDREVHEPHYPQSEFLIPLGGRIFVGYENKLAEISVPSFLKTQERHSFFTKGIGLAFNTGNQSKSGNITT